MPPSRMKNPIRLETRIRRRRLAEKKRTIGWRRNQRSMGPKFAGAVANADSLARAARLWRRIAIAAAAALPAAAEPAAREVWTRRRPALAIAPMASFAPLLSAAKPPLSG